MKVELQVIKGPEKGKTFTFTKHDTFLVGRSHDAHLRFSEDDRTISRYHLFLEINPPNCFIKDLDSTNGTFINDDQKPITEKMIKNGDQIIIGHTTLLVKIIKSPQKPIISPAKHISGAPQVDGYQILKLLGKGGMGAAWLAKNSFGKEVVIKTMLPKESIEEKDIAVFKREIAITASLNHRNIVKFLDYGFTRYQMYFVMEYVKGIDAYKLLDRRNWQVSIEEAFPIIHQVLLGLAHAHKNNIVHRDIKPPNILLKPEKKFWKAKLADLGLAKNYQLSGMSGFTFKGQHGGSYPWMPREQIIDFKYVKPVSDVFAVGATFYHLLTGFTVYNFHKSKNDINVILYEMPIPIHERNPNIPSKLAYVIDKSVRRNHEERYQSADEFRIALEKACGM